MNVADMAQQLQEQQADIDAQIAQLQARLQGLQSQRAQVVGDLSDAQAFVRLKGQGKLS